MWSAPRGGTSPRTVIGPERTRGLHVRAVAFQSVRPPQHHTYAHSSIWPSLPAEKAGGLASILTGSCGRNIVRQFTRWSGSGLPAEPNEVTSRMRRYLIRRLLQGIPVLFVVSLLVFLVLNLLPGDPVMARQGAFMDANYTQLMATLKQQMGLDRPIPERYAIWVWHALQGDFGVSYITQNSVAGLIAQKLPATLELTVLSLVLALLVALPAGIFAAVRPNSWLDLAVTSFVTMGLAIPRFWLGMMLMILFAVQLGLLPAAGYTGADHRSGTRTHDSTRKAHDGTGFDHRTGSHDGARSHDGACAGPHHR